ncbi:Hypothetical predicted protein [Cloeon dipterum]|uniref:C2H2-type domain-containing protein n=1 Tax=Cloeon dipterum TaxID=197152 RepID=A0A8S1CLQ6_9INSE|nr:Hypothetical predicted protein [Cloeon dipterum]
MTEFRVRKLSGRKSPIELNEDDSKESEVEVVSGSSEMAEPQQTPSAAYCLPGTSFGSNQPSIHGLARVSQSVFPNQGAGCLLIEQMNLQPLLQHGPSHSQEKEAVPSAPDQSPAGSSSSGFGSQGYLKLSEEDRNCPLHPCPHQKILRMPPMTKVEKKLQMRKSDYLDTTAQLEDTMESPIFNQPRQIEHKLENSSSEESCSSSVQSPGSVGLDPEADFFIFNLEMSSSSSGGESSSQHEEKLIIEQSLNPAPQKDQEQSDETIVQNDILGPQFEKNRTDPAAQDYQIYQCSYCDESFDSLIELWEHMEEEH